MPYMLDYEVERGLCSRKDDSASPLLSIQKETLWNGKLSHHYIYHYQKGPCYCIYMYS